jgi:hypothetical protein
MWQKGQSGNPHGRPKQALGAAARLAALIDERTGGGVELLETLLAELRAPALTTADRNRRVNIIGMLLDRWAGKPLATVDVTTREERTGPDLSILTDDDFAAISRVLEQRIEASGGTPPTVQ